MDTILGIEIYPLISLGIFFTFFVVMGIMVAGLSRKKIDAMANIPLND